MSCIGNTHNPRFANAKQLRLLLKAVSSRIRKLEDQEVALNEALSELRDVESQAHTALAALESGSRRATG
jgi:exonuclease VII small subunit